jgi:hypothetical protein
MHKPIRVARCIAAKSEWSILRDKVQPLKYGDSSVASGVKFNPWLGV